LPFIVARKIEEVKTYRDADPKREGRKKPAAVSLL
jgi:hypothetical protein